MNVAIIGCGRMGQKRAAALGDDCIMWACDSDLAVAEKISQAEYLNSDWRPCVADVDVEAVIVCTPHNMLAEIALAAVIEGKHVLIEKPGGIHCDDLTMVMAAAECSGSKVRVGYTLRYHRAVLKAREMVTDGDIGELMYVRGRYGHGGRPGMEKEWRCDPTQSGGGELIDQGVHLIDLARWFMGGEFKRKAYGVLTTFWPVPVEDNAFLLMGTDHEPQKGAFLHASWTEWKNLFSFEIFGTQGKIEISGLGGSYGPETLTHYAMSPQMGPPIQHTTVWHTPDDSFETEWQEFVRDIREDREPSPGISDAQAVLRVVEQIYGK